MTDSHQQPDRAQASMVRVLYRLTVEVEPLTAEELAERLDDAKTCNVRQALKKLHRREYVIRRKSDQMRPGKKPYKYAVRAPIHSRPFHPLYEGEANDLAEELARVHERLDRVESALQRGINQR